MSNFELDGEANDPFDEEESPTGGQDTDSQDEGSNEKSPAMDSPSKGGDSSVQSMGTQQSERSSDGHEAHHPDGISDLSPGTGSSPADIAKALTSPEYKSENPPVPYAVWRDTVLAGRKRKTVEINDDVEDLVREVAVEFETRVGTPIYKADLRELALAYGLMHVDELCEMAEEWGIKYDR